MKINREILLLSLFFLFIFDAELNSRGSESVQTNLTLQDNTDSTKQNELGDKFYNATNYSKALEWYRKAADQGNANAQTSLGFMYANGSGVAQDTIEAVNWYRKAADQGNTEAQNNLGFMYANGSGVAQDPVEAVKWYLKAADQGNADAQNNLGLMYANGNGVAKDLVEAVKWYRKAADQGNATAQNNLGLIYANGSGVTQDPVEAIKWYRKAADQGYATAQNNLGLMYANGNGVAKDLVEAVKWYRKAADQRYDWGQNNLGTMYENGNGVTQDPVEAIKWYRKAADQGNAIAQNNLAALADKQIIPLSSSEALKGQKSMAVEVLVADGSSGDFPSLNGLEDSIKSQLKQNGITIVSSTDKTVPILKLWVKKIRYAFAGRGFAINAGTFYYFSLNYIQIIPLQAPIAGKRFIQATIWSEDAVGYGGLISGGVQSQVAGATSDFIKDCQNTDQGK